MDRFPRFLLFAFLCAIISNSYATVLEYLLDRNTDFNCLVREGDEETGLTFAIDNYVYRRDDLGQFVRFVRQIRNGQGGQLNITTTVVFSKNANGSMLWCCYFDGTHISWRESFLLLCLCHSETEATTTLADATTKDNSPPMILTEMQTSTKDSPSVVTLVVAILLILGLACCWYFIPCGVVAPYGGIPFIIQSLRRQKANGPPYTKKVMQETDQALITPSNTPISKSRMTVMHQTQLPAYAVVRADSSFSTVLGDDMPPVITPVIAKCGESGICETAVKESLPQPTKCTSDNGDEDISQCLFFKPRSTEYFCQEATKDHEVALPPTRTPSNLSNENIYSRDVPPIQEPSI